MMKRVKSYVDLSPPLVILLVIFVPLICFAGWKVYSAGKSDKPASVHVQLPLQESKTVTGFLEYTVPELGLTFSYPRTWTVEKKKVSANINAGLPVIKIKSMSFKPISNHGYIIGTGTLVTISSDLKSDNIRSFGQEKEFYKTKYMGNDQKDTTVSNRPAFQQTVTYKGPPTLETIIEKDDRLIISAAYYSIKDVHNSSLDPTNLALYHQIVGSIIFN